MSLTVTYVGQNVAWTATNALLLNISFHKVHALGELIERIDGDVSELL